MTATQQTPVRAGQLPLVAKLLGAAAVWVAVYRLNKPLWDWLYGDLLGLDLNGRLGGALHFFSYDTIKITLLLTGIIFVVTVLRSFMSVERTRALLGGRREGIGNVLAAGLGVVTPFCSCSAVPAFIGFVAAGVPLLVLAGSLGDGYQALYPLGVRAILPIVPGPVSLAQALDRAADNLRRTARMAAAVWASAGGARRQSD